MSLRAALLSLLLSGAQADPPPGRRFVVLETSAGDIALALHTESAPRHSAKFLELVRLGAYDSVHFFKVDPGRVLHLSGMSGRRRALDPRQKAALKKPPLETAAMRVRYGTVVVAHDPSDPDPFRTSLAIMLADVPSMEGKYTVLGEVERGFETLEAIRGAACDARRRPLKRIEVERAYVAQSPEALSALRGPSGPLRAPAPGAPRGARIGAGLAAVLGLASAILAIYLRKPRLVSVSLLLALAAYVSALVGWGPDAQRSAWISVGLFAGALAVFKAMSHFEGAR